MDERLVTLEVRYTHLQHQVDQLSQVVFDQQKLIDRLTSELAIMRARTSGVEEGTSRERPPHY